MKVVNEPPWNGATVVKVLMVSGVIADYVLSLHHKKIARGLGVIIRHSASDLNTWQGHKE